MSSLLQNLLTDGGPLVYIILFFGVIAFLIFIERMLYLQRVNVDTHELLRGLLNHLRNGNVKEAIVNCDSKTGPAGEIFRSGIEQWSAGENSIRYAVDETARIVIPRLESNMKLLGCIANTTPVMGLLGTLFWMMSIFSKMEEKGGHFIETIQLAGDIRGALICTAAGLIVALGAQLFYFCIRERIDHQIQEMEKGTAEIVFFLSNHPAPAQDNEPGQRTAKD